MRVLLLSLLLPLLSLATAASAQERPVVVELFTSQGCSSCPPADALLGELAARPDVLALAFHVDYWDRLGWADPFSAAWATARQRAYARAWGTDQIYTPQAVVDGTTALVGSDRRALEAAIAASRGEPSIPLTLAGEGATLTLGVDGDAPADATLWLVGFDAERKTAVARGENAGSLARDRNVVRALQPLDGWRDGPLTVPRPAGERVALLLQAADGRILGAARL